MLMLTLTQTTGVARTLGVCVTLRLTHDPSSPLPSISIKTVLIKYQISQKRLVAKHSASVDLEFAEDVYHLVSDKIMYSAQL